MEPDTLEGAMRLDGKVLRYGAATGARGYPVYRKYYRLRYTRESVMERGSLYDVLDPVTGELVTPDEPGYRFDGPAYDEVPK